MHETSMAYAILDIVSKIMSDHPGKQLTIVHLQIGQMSAVVPELLQSAYEGIIQNSPLENSKLVINIIPIQGTCLQCNKSFTLEEFVFSCPHCQSYEIQVTHGNELHILSIEVV